MITSIYPRTNSVTKTNSVEEVQYPEDVQIIIRSDKPTYGSLFLSNLETAKNPNLLKKLKIGAILTATKDCQIQHPKNIVKFSKYIPLQDNEKCNIYEYLDDSVSFIQEKLKITNVLVHCVSGISKSAAIVIAYIMKDRKLRLQDAFNEVKSRRKIIAPHKHILNQLKKYEIELNEKINMTQVYTEKQTVNYNNLTIRKNMINSISQKSKTREKTIQQEKNHHSNLYANQLLPQYIDDLKSMRSYKSNYSRFADLDKSKPNIQNPEESFVSKKSQKSKLDNSLAKSRQRSQLNETNIILDKLEGSHNQSRKSTISRDEFNKKMRKMDSFNEEINLKIQQVQQQFQTENKAHKQALEKELYEINKRKSQIYSQFNERKSRITTRRTMHNQTMQDLNVKKYISNLPIPDIILL